MDELIAKAMQGVDPDDPGAFLTILSHLLAAVPWWNLLLWQLACVVVGGLLGWWRGRTKAGVIAALVLGPFGWVVPFIPRRVPPPLPPSAASAARPLPPLPGSKKR